MPRIRSIQPGQWTDGDFVGMSPMARLLAIGLRNYADDNGVFKWKLTDLKMEIFPADNCDMEALLKEWLEHQQGRQFEAGGRVYGQCRNFIKWQRPRKPMFHHPVPPSAPDYEHNAAYRGASTELGEVKGARGPDPPSSKAPLGAVKVGKRAAEVEKRGRGSEPLNSVGAIPLNTDDAGKTGARARDAPSPRSAGTGQREQVPSVELLGKRETAQRVAKAGAK